MMNSVSRAIVALLPALVLAGPVVRAAEPAYEIETHAEGLAHPWCVAFLPGGDQLVTLRGGELLRLAPDGSLAARVANVPPVYAQSQGGLFDVLPDPSFATNRRLYLSFAHGTPEANATRVVRARLVDDRLRDVETLVTVEPRKDTPVHFGGRLALLPDATLLVTTGDGFDYREEAQRLSNLMGKTLRIETDGAVPDDNPFVDRADARPEIWTYGHRNAQGLIVTRDGSVYQHEHGARGGDELNRLEAGRNYGWPVITHGIDYSGARITPYTEMPGMEQPLAHWTPSIAPSGLARYDGDAFPAWQGDLFVGALVDRNVRRIELEAGRVVAQHTLFGEAGARIRDVRVGPEGFLYLLTDAADGRVLRVRPAGTRGAASGDGSGARPARDPS